MTASGQRIYLDHNASAPLLPQAREAMIAALDLVGNASSVHTEGRRSRAALNAARSQVARLVNAQPQQVTFTSGASEAAATCLTPNWLRDGHPHLFPRLAVLETDHPCVREGGRFAVDQVTRLPVSVNGIVDLRSLREWVSGGAGLLALTGANSETGAIQPLREIAELLAGTEVAFVLDAVQMAGRIPLDLSALRADAVILSGHKFGAPKGVGAFILANEQLRPTPLVTGGAQELRQRAGTEALPAIAAFGAAAVEAHARGSHAEALRVKRDYVRSTLSGFEGVHVIEGPDELQLPQTIAVFHPGMRAETVQIALDLEGISVSAGSACSSGKLGASHVLSALAQAGLAIEPDLGAIRISFGHETREDELDYFLSAYEKLWRRFAPEGERRRAA